MNIKHLLFCALALLTSLCAIAQECNVPISVYVRNATTREVKRSSDQSCVNLAHLLERHGFTTEVHNTCVAIGLVTSTDSGYCAGSKKRMDVEIKFINAYTGSTLYSAHLDKYYCGDSQERDEQLIADLSGPFPPLDSLADSIHACVVEAFEINTEQVAKVAHDFAIHGEHDAALFSLVQYPSCCPSYTKIQNIMLAIFRDYMQHDHNALLNVAVSVMRNRKTVADARFVVSLLNSVQFTEKEQKKADGVFLTIANEYPALDMKAEQDYTFDAELREIALSVARAIGIECSISGSTLDDTATSKSRANFFKKKVSDRSSLDGDWYTGMMDVYNVRTSTIQKRLKKGV